MRRQPWSRIYAALHQAAAQAGRHFGRHQPTSRGNVGCRIDSGSIMKSCFVSRLACAVLVTLCALLAPGHSVASATPNPAYGHVELVRDTWGIPHIFSDTDAGAMYGLGYAAAEDRGFQMTYNLRIIQGRFSEIVGIARAATAGNFARSRSPDAHISAGPAMPREPPRIWMPRRLAPLKAYCEGQRQFRRQESPGSLHPLFRRLRVEVEPWTPADCLLSWWHLAQFFATDGTRDLMAWRNRSILVPACRNRPNLEPLGGRQYRGGSARMMFRPAGRKALRHSLMTTRWAEQGEGEAGPEFSHAWVVGGTKTTTGSAVLVSDPQTPVRNPSLWMEFHMKGKTLNARGVGVPGSPGLLIGFNRQCSLGLDRFGRGSSGPLPARNRRRSHDNTVWNGEWRRMKVRTERLRVKGAPDVLLNVRETHLGPVASEFCFRQPGDPEVALKRVPWCETKHDTIESVFGIMRARNAEEFLQAAGGWRFPLCEHGVRRCPRPDRLHRVGRDPGPVQDRPRRQREPGHRRDRRCR